MCQEGSAPGAQTFKVMDQEKIFRYICGAAALLLTVLLFVFLFQESKEKQGKDRAAIIVFGDSVMGEVRDETAIPAQLGELLDTTVYNAAFGGTCAARLERNRPLDYTIGMFSLVALTKAAEAGDFGAHQSVVVRESNTQYFGETIDGLERLDFSQAEVFIIQQGINDYMVGVPIDNSEDPYDDYTFLGALRVAVASLRKTNPEARIVFLTPLFTWFTLEGMTCEEKDCGGGVLEDYVNAQILLAAELDVEVIDLYHDRFPHDQWEDWQLYSRDGLHPNEAGRERIALEIADYLGKKR